MSTEYEEAPSKRYTEMELEGLIQDLQEAAQRFNDGKAPLHHLRFFKDAREEIAWVCEMGAEKYGKYNWMKGGAPVSESIDSADRHIDKFLSGQDCDDESGLHHLAHAAWNLIRACDDMLSGRGKDDRDV